MPFCGVWPCDCVEEIMKRLFWFSSIDALEGLALNVSGDGRDWSDWSTPNCDACTSTALSLSSCDSEEYSELDSLSLLVLSPDDDDSSSSVISRIECDVPVTEAASIRPWLRSPCSVVKVTSFSSTKLSDEYFGGPLWFAGPYSKCPCDIISFPFSDALSVASLSWALLVLWDSSSLLP